MFTALTRNIKQLLLFCVGAVLVLFAVSNHQPVSVSFLPIPYQIELPLFLMGIFFLIIGALAGWFVAKRDLHKARRAVRLEHQRVSALQNEISALKSERQSAFPLTKKL